MGIFTKLTQIKELPALPEMLVKVRRLINSDDSGASQLAKLIEQDPAIASTILRTANSAYYNISRRQIDSISEAITRIGFNEVQKITVAISVIKQFTGSGHILDYKNFWQHSIAAASLTSYISDMCDCKGIGLIREHLYMSGLLHDIGILILDQFFHDEFYEVAKKTIDEGKTFLEIEKSMPYKESHAFIGGALLEIWKIAPEITASVRFHHIPEKASQSMRGIVSVVSIAEYLLCNSRYSFEGVVDKPSLGILGYLGIPFEDKGFMDALNKQASEELEKASIIINSTSSNTMLQLNSGSGKRRDNTFTLRSI